MKIICPHCGQVIEIEGISLPQSRALMVNINALLDEADIEYDSRKQAVKNHFRQANSTISYVFPKTDCLNPSCRYAGCAICFTGFSETEKQELLQKILFPERFSFSYVGLMPVRQKSRNAKN